MKNDKKPRPKPARRVPAAVWLMTAEAGSALERAAFALWRAARARGWAVTVALPLRRQGAFGAPQTVLERWPIELELGPGEFRGEARQTAAEVDDADRLCWLVPQSADLSPASTSAFLCAGALDLARRQEVRIVHCFGLRGSLAPVLLSTRLGADSRFEELRALVAVEPEGDLGLIDAPTLHDLGLPPGLLAEPLGGVGGQFSALKAGIVFADRVVVASARSRRALAATAVGQAALERGRDLVAIPWMVEAPAKPARKPSKRAANAPAPAAAAAAEDPVHVALDRIATLYRGVLRKPPRRVEVAVPPRAAVEAPDAVPAEPPAEPFIDWGPALPERYGEDACELLVQSPRSLYAYWELSPETQRAAGADLFLRLRGRRGERPLGRLPGSVGEWWIDVEPGEVYVLDIVAGDGRALLRSAPARTPLAGPAQTGEVRMVHRDRLRGAANAAAARAEAVAPRLPPLPALAQATIEETAPALATSRDRLDSLESPPATPFPHPGAAPEPPRRRAPQAGADRAQERARDQASGSGSGPDANGGLGGSSEQRPRRSS